MKGLITFLIILNSAFLIGQEAEFSFDKKVFKSKPIHEGEILEHTFSFNNTGEVPLIISGYEVECTCTLVEHPTLPILPGESGEIKIQFNSEGKIGWQYRKIILLANTKKQQETIEFRVKVLN